MSQISAHPAWLSVLYRSPLVHLIGSAAHLGLQLLQVMVIGHVLGVEVIGHYGYCLAIITPVLLLATWHVRHARVVDAAGIFAWQAYARLRSAGLCAAFILLASGLLIPGLQEIGPLFAALVILKISDLWMDLPYSSYQRTGEIGRIGIGVGGRGVLSTLAFIMLLTGLGTLSGAIIAQAMVSWVWWLSVERPGLRTARDFGERDGAEASPMSLWRRVWPLGLTVALGSLVASFPRIALAERHGAEEAGHYLLLGYLFIPALLLQGSLQQSVVPKLAATAHQGKSNEMVRLLLRLAVHQAAALLVVMGGVWGVQSLFSLSWVVRGFAISLPELAWFTGGLILVIMNNVIGLAMDAVGFFRAKLVHWLMIAISSSALTWWLADRGIVGAGIAAVVAGVIGVLVGGWWLARLRLPAEGGPDHGS